MYLSILIPMSSLTDYLCIFRGFPAEVSSKRLERSSGTTEIKRELLWITAFKWICAWKHWPREIGINPCLHWNHFGVLTLFQFLPQNNVISGARTPQVNLIRVSHTSAHIRITWADFYSVRTASLIPPPGSESIGLAGLIEQRICFSKHSVGAGSGSKIWEPV